MCFGRFKGVIIRVQCGVYNVYMIYVRGESITTRKQVRFGKNKPNLISRGDAAGIHYTHVHNNNMYAARNDTTHKHSAQVVLRTKGLSVSKSNKHR